ncbi:MAG: hypothetical protein CMD22_03950 [Flavobacteriales bacterium]|nr:hypothetical protein [Flavobacteriales bacterium]|tara:strand:- start:2090 stop:3541 length:1452 start_codon:yes stop_codon:yes gene_type:complete
MNILLKTIESLNKEEIRYYKIFSNRTHNEKNRKDAILFESIKNNLNDYNEKEIAAKMYGNKKNNFYQLKNNLLHGINKSIVSQHTNKEDDTSLYNIILLSRIYKRKGDVDLSYHYLKKAEKQANKIESFEILSIIYSEILKLSYELISIDIEKYINRKIENKKKLDLSQEIDITLYSVMYSIKTTQNFSNDTEVNSKALNKIINSITSQKQISKSPKFRIKLFEAISRTFLQKNDFVSLEKYLKSTYKDFIKDKIFNKTNHEQKLMMLTYLTNSLYKNGKMKESLLIAEKLNNSMSEFDSFLKNRFLFYYYNALVINYSKLDQEKALQVLNKAKRNKVIQSLPTFGSFIYLNMGLIYYNQKKYKTSIKHFSRLILQKDFINLSLEFQLKILISEIIIRYELNQTDLVEEKIKIIKRTYKETINNNIREKDIIEIINKLIYCDNLSVNKDLVSKIKRLIEQTSSKKAQNIDVINYNDWLLKQIS